MGLIETALAVAIGVSIYDYMSVKGSAAKFASFNYQYWPPSNFRWVGVVALAAGVFITFALMHAPGPDNRIWVILPGSLGLIFHGCVTIADMFRQKRVAKNDRTDS
jgi:purine-cytosine permease-like protein